MKKLLTRTSIILSLLFVIHSCVTINIYFPAAAVEKAADRIVEEVWGEEGVQPAKPQGDNNPESFLRQLMDYVFYAVGPEEAFAQDADINVTTPAIRAMKESIKARAEFLKPYLDNGNAGLSNDGLLVVRSSDGLSLKSKAVLTRLIKAENSDRNTLYSEIARANNYTPERVKDIAEIFAGSWIKQARKGWLVQSPGGKWSGKQ
jgi:uncharacterized protein YdbL (DUF1318 family)